MRLLGNFLFLLLLQGSMCYAADLERREREIERARRQEEADRRAGQREFQRQEEHAAERRYIQQERDFAQRALAGISDPDSTEDNHRQSENRDSDGNQFQRLFLRMRLMTNPDFRELPHFFQEFIIDRMLRERLKEQAPIEKADDDVKMQVNAAWQSWMQKQEHMPEESEAECCICFEEDPQAKSELESSYDTSYEPKMNFIPCKAERLHPNKICIDCLSTCITNPKADGFPYCPICNTKLAFRLKR